MRERESKMDNDMVAFTKGRRRKNGGNVLLRIGDDQI
jgi:hypothetical protein